MTLTVNEFNEVKSIKADRSWFKSGNPMTFSFQLCNLKMAVGAESRGDQSSLSSTPLWSGVIDQPGVTTVTAASRPPSYRAEEGYVSAIFSREQRAIRHDSRGLGLYRTCRKPMTPCSMSVWSSTHTNIIDPVE